MLVFIFQIIDDWSKKSRDGPCPLIQTIADDAKTLEHHGAVQFQIHDCGMKCSLDHRSPMCTLKFVLDDRAIIFSKITEQYALILLQIFFQIPQIFALVFLNKVMRETFHDFLSTQLDKFLRVFLKYPKHSPIYGLPLAICNLSFVSNKLSNEGFYWLNSGTWTAVPIHARRAVYRTHCAVHKHVFSMFLRFNCREKKLNLFS